MSALRKLANPHAHGRLKGLEFMGVLRNSIAAIIRKPFTVIYMGFLVLILLVLARLNPVFPLIAGFSKAADADFFEQVISILQFFMQPDVLPYLVPGIIVLSTTTGFLFSLFLSGYFYVLNNACGKASSKTGKDFARGTRQLFLKIFVISSISMAALIVFAIFMLVASVPLMILLRSATIENIRMLLISVLVMLLTIFVLFLGSMYFRVYIYFWFPAAACGHKKPFRTGKRVADQHFWKLVFALFMFDVILISGMFLFTYFEDNIYLFAAKWLFLTLYFTLLSSYVFSAYVLGRE
jgi:hypothetical protein